MCLFVLAWYVVWRGLGIDVFFFIFVIFFWSFQFCGHVYGIIASSQCCQFAQKYSEIIDIKLNNNIRLVVAAPLFNCEFTSRLPTQFIRPSGIDCTKYSRCSFSIKHIGRFFCVISSSRSFNDCNSSGNQINSHEHINGLSKNERPIRKNEQKAGNNVD